MPTETTTAEMWRQILMTGCAPQAVAQLMERHALAKHQAFEREPTGVRWTLTLYGFRDGSVLAVNHGLGDVAAMEGRVPATTDGLRARLRQIAEAGVPA